MADATTWAVFFTGKYKVFADGIEEGIMHLKFGATDPERLAGQGSRGAEHFTLYLRLEDGEVPGLGHNIAGGHLFARYTKGAAIREFVLLTYELMERKKDWVVGLDPTGQRTRIRFEAFQGGSLVFESMTIKKRPDTNYPWNV